MAPLVFIVLYCIVILVLLSPFPQHSTFSSQIRVYSINLTCRGNAWKVVTTVFKKDQKGGGEYPVRITYQVAANTVSSKSITEGAGRPQIYKLVRPSGSSSHNENWAGLAQVHTRLLDFDGKEPIFDDVGTNDSIGLDSNDHSLKRNLPDESQ